MTIKNTKPYKDYKKAKAAVEEVEQSRQKMTEALRDQSGVIEKAKADLKKAKQEQSEAEDQAAISGDMSLIEEVTVKVSTMEKALENLVRAYESTQRVIDKAEEKHKELRHGLRHFKEQYMLAYANQLEKEVQGSDVRDKVMLLITLRQRATGHYHGDHRKTWLFSLFPEHDVEEEYPALDEVLN